MKLRRRSGKGFDETSASSDVAFLLIIYFIVIAGFNVNQGFLMTLPAKDSTRLILKDDLLRFDLDGAGNLFHQGAPLSHAQAEGEIQGAIASHPNLAVLLTVDGGAPWQAVVSFVELAQRQEVESFSFTLKKDDGGSP
ncbi:MAG: biopolymer transporter ExbD [Treponema sp.]|jgi:biopolymer transport protein ExbD|nr:biopolymer transporter ExbD [Treponema sp.]